MMAMPRGKATSVRTSLPSGMTRLGRVSSAHCWAAACRTACLSTFWDAPSVGPAAGVPARLPLALVTPATLGNRGRGLRRVGGHSRLRRHGCRRVSPQLICPRPGPVRRLLDPEPRAAPPLPGGRVLAPLEVGNPLSSLPRRPPTQSGLATALWNPVLRPLRPRRRSLIVFRSASQPGRGDAGWARGRRP